MNTILTHYRAVACTIAASLMLLGTGCVSVQSLSTAARAGDTVTLAVGSAEDMSVANTSAVFVPDAGGAAIPVDIRNIFNVYPDKTSDVWLNDVALPFIPDTTAHAPWQTLIVVDLPASLPVGAGQLDVSTTAGYSSFQPDINNTPISLEILPGTGAPHQFPVLPSSYNTEPVAGDLSRLEPLPQIVVQPPASPGSNGYGAVELRISAAINTSFGQTAPIAVIPDETITGSGSQVLWTREDDLITVNYINPTGSLPTSALRFSIVPLGNNVVMPTNPPPSLLSVRYFYANGLETSGPTPTLTVKN